MMVQARPEELCDTVATLPVLAMPHRPFLQPLRRLQELSSTGTLLLIEGTIVYRSIT